MSLGPSLAQMRRDNRVTVVLPVKISPHDEPTKVRAACTCEVSGRGAKLMKIDGVSEGDILSGSHAIHGARNSRWFGSANQDLNRTARSASKASSPKSSSGMMIFAASSPKQKSFTSDHLRLRIPGLSIRPVG